MSASTRRVSSPLLFKWSNRFGLDAQQRLWALSGNRIVTATYDRGGTAGAASALDQNGRLYVPGYKSPRWHHDPSNLSLGPLLLLEGSRQNLCLQSNAFTTTWAASGATSTAQNQTDPAGVANSAWTLGDTDGAVIADFRQTVTVPNDSTKWTFSAFLKKTTSAASFPGIGIIFIGGSAALVQATINTDTGAGTIRTGSTAGATVSVTSISATYWRASVTIANDTSGNTSARIAMYPAVNTDGSATWAAATTGTAVFGFDQFENAAFPSSYIPTTTVAVTRAADSLSFPFLPSPQAMTVYADFVEGGTYLDSAAAVAVIGDAAANRQCFLLGAQTGFYRASAQASGSTTNAQAIAGPLVGNRVELRGAFAANGGVTLGQTISSGTEAVVTTASAGAFDATFSGPLLTLTGYTGAQRVFLALRSLKVCAGVQTLDTMRAA